MRRTSKNWVTATTDDNPQMDSHPRRLSSLARAETKIQGTSKDPPLSSQRHSHRDSQKFPNARLPSPFPPSQNRFPSPGTLDCTLTDIQAVHFKATIDTFSKSTGIELIFFWICCAEVSMAPEMDYSWLETMCAGTRALSTCLFTRLDASMSQRGHHPFDGSISLQLPFQGMFSNVSKGCCDSTLPFNKYWNKTPAFCTGKKN